MQQPLVICLTLLISGLSPAAADGGASSGETKFSAAGVHVEAEALSGTVWVSRAPEAEQDANSVEVALLGLAELGANMSAALNNSAADFATQNFTLTAPVQTSLQNVSATLVELSATPRLKGVAAGLTVSVHLFTGSGNVSLGGESVRVAPGHVRIGYLVSGWQWCGAAAGDVQCLPPGTGSGVRLTVGVRSRSKPKNKGVAGTPVYDLGGGASCIASQKVSVDGVWKDAAPGYPMFETQGSKDVLVFFSSKFNQSVSYSAYFVAAPTIGPVGAGSRLAAPLGALLGVLVLETFL